MGTLGALCTVADNVKRCHRCGKQDEVPQKQQKEPMHRLAIAPVGVYPKELRGDSLPPTCTTA